MDPAKHADKTRRIQHYDAVSRHKKREARPGAYYHQLLEAYYRFLVPSRVKVLEVGCGHGDLLAAVSPSFGVGIDFSSDMVRTASEKYPHLHFVQAEASEIPLDMKFDVIILSDLVNDVWDLQQILENMKYFCDEDTRIIINFFNNLWRPPLFLAQKLGLGFQVLEQNWFSPNDVINLLHITGYETIKKTPHILMPVPVPLVSGIANRYLSKIVPFSWLALTNFLICRPIAHKRSEPSVSVIVPARNEAGNIEPLLNRMPDLGSSTELIFVEGHSRDGTYETIASLLGRYPGKDLHLYRQSGEGKGDAVRLGFQKAKGDILIILDADMTVPPEDLPRFVRLMTSGAGEFVNGVRLVYPLENQSMRFFNILGNKFFSLAFTWLLGQPIKDTLCGTKVLWKHHYADIEKNRSYFGDFDPFGDFDLLFGASKLNLKIIEMPVRYRYRRYGDTNIQRWRHGWLLLKMVVFAALRIKFV